MEDDVVDLTPRLLAAIREKTDAEVDRLVGAVVHLAKTADEHANLLA